MKKSLAALLIFSFTLTSTSHLWAADPKPGAKCLRAGQIGTIPGYKFKCIKVKNKLVWDKGTSTAPKAPSSSTPKASASPAPTSDPYLISPASINSFQDAVTRYKDIKYWAWKRAAIEVEKNTSSESILNVLVGPNSKECSDAGTRAIRAMQKLYSESQLPVKSTLIYAAKEDNTWTKSAINGSFPDSNPPQDAFGVNTKSEAFILHSDYCNSKDVMAISGAAIAHGYTHSLQKIQYLESKENWGNFPRWLIEGGATFSENFIQYGKDYKTWITNPGFHNWDLKQYDNNFYRDFYDYKLQSDGKYTWVHTDQWPNQRVYDVGSYACEVLIAIKGPSSIIRLNSEFAKSGNFEKSFEIVYGLSWKEALPLLASAVHQSTTWLVNTPNGLK